MADDYEGDMAQTQLNAIVDMAGELADIIDDEDELEAWVQAKITKAKDYIQAAYDSLMHDDDDNDDDDQMDESLNEESNYKVKVDGLPAFYMTGDSPEHIKMQVRKLLRKPEAIDSVERVTKAAMLKAFRLKGMGKEEEVAEDIIRHSDMKRVKVKTPDGRVVWRNVKKEIPVGEQVDEARRGRPSKTQDGDQEGIEHIMVQLRKVISLRGQKPVEFADGKKVNMQPKHAEMVLAKIASIRDGKKKQDFVNKISKSPDAMKQAMREKD